MAMGLLSKVVSDKVSGMVLVLLVVISNHQESISYPPTKSAWKKLFKCLLFSDQFAWLPGLLKSDEPEKVPPSEKELKVASNEARNWLITISLKLFQEEEKRKLAQEEAEKERKKKHIKEEYQREKVSNTNLFQVN